MSLFNVVRVIISIIRVFRYAKLYQLLGQVSNLQILGGPGVCKTELVTTLANMFGIRDLIVLASSSITSMRSRSNVGAGLPLLITDPRKPDKLGNFIDSDLLHSAYQIDANETKTYGTRVMRGPIVVTANTSVLGQQFVSDENGRASLQRLTTITFSDREVTLTAEGKAFTDSIKDCPGKFIPLLAMVGREFTRSSSVDLVDKLKTHMAECKVDNVPDRMYRDRAAQCWHVNQLNATVGGDIITESELDMIVKETFTFYTETIKGAPRESPDSFWSRVSLTLTSVPGAWSIRDIALQGSVNTQYLCISSVTWRQIPSMPLLQDVRDFFPSAKFSHKVRLDSRVRSKGTALLHLFPKAVVPTELWEVVMEERRRNEALEAKQDDEQIVNQSIHVMSDDEDAANPQVKMGLGAITKERYVV